MKQVYNVRANALRATKTSVQMVGLTTWETTVYELPRAAQAQGRRLLRRLRADMAARPEGWPSGAPWRRWWAWVQTVEHGNGADAMALLEGPVWARVLVNDCRPH